MIDKYYSQSREEMLDFVPKTARDVLEIGCGEGAFGEILQNRNGCRVTGVDLSGDAVTVARTKLFRAYQSTVEVFLAEHHELYDVICCNDILEHLVDPWTQVRRCRKLLRENGCLVVSIPNIRFLNALRDILIHQDFPYDDTGIFDRTHLRFFTRKSIFRFFTECAYEVVRCEGINGLTSRRYTWANRLTFRRFEDVLYPQFGVVAKPSRAAKGIPVIVSPNAQVA